MYAARWVASALFIACIPIFLVLSNVRVAAAEERVFGYGFSTYNVPAITGIERVQLDRAAHEIVQYFTSGDTTSLLDIRVRVAGGETQPLYNEREIIHMRDVKQLFQLVFRLHEVAFAYIVAYIAGVYLWSREQSLRRLAQQAMTGGIATVVILGAMAVMMLVGFDQLFLLFHQMSFANDFWQLDPATDRLVQMFPQGFWFDVSIGVGALTVLEGGLVALAGYAYLEWSERRADRRRRARLRARAEAEALIVTPQ
ncbi:MAG: TIGR01906 family membrane protein [Dehalococcoidia bacterium]